MTRHFLTIVLIMDLTLCSAASSAAEFVDMVRDLTALQNRMVTGDEKARELVARQFDEIETKIPELGPDEWALTKNTRAAIVYLLGGGAPTAIRELYDAGFFSPEDASLVEASLLYAEGGSEAKEKLKSFDPRAYPAVLGGHLALVQGGALIDEKNPAASDALDLARLLMPTSLVEEAALRREIRALDPVKSSAKLNALAQIYVRKYRKSPYARNFWAEIRALIFRTPRDVNFEMAERFADILDSAPPAEQFDLKAAIFRSALLKGNIGEAMLWLEKAAEVAAPGPNQERVIFYRALMANLGGAGDSKEQKPAAAVPTPRDPEDQMLRDLSINVVRRIETPGTAPSSNKDMPPPEEPGGIEKSAHALIEEVDSLLRKRN
jgi:chemotaxis protein MotC